MNKIDRDLLEKITDLHKIELGAFNIRKNGQVLDKKNTKEIEIVPKKDKSGIDVFIKPNVKDKALHIPVIITMGGLDDLVYNDFYVGENASITIVAGCGIHNVTTENSVHNGIHSFHLEKNAKVKYIERHIGTGDGSGGKILNPITNIFQKENSILQIETVQIGGVTSSIRKTKARLGNNAKLEIKENILTEVDQTAKTQFVVNLKGKNSSVEVVSHSVARDKSYQEFKSNLVGENECFGHVECDGILLDSARIVSVPMIDAKDNNSSLVHEAAIGKIAGDELVKLMTLGLSKEDAESMIIKGFLMGN